MMFLIAQTILAQTISEQCKREYQTIQDTVTQGCFNRRFDSTNISLNDFLPAMSDGLSSICAPRCIQITNQANTTTCADELVLSTPPLTGRDVISFFKVIQRGICVQERGEFCFRNQYPKLKFIDFDRMKFEQITTEMLKNPQLICSTCLESQIQQMATTEQTAAVAQLFSIFSNFVKSVCVRDLKPTSGSFLSSANLSLYLIVSFIL